MGSVVVVDRGTLELSTLPWSPSLAPENSLGYLYSFPNAKIWIKRHKIRKGVFQSTLAVSYQNADTCRKLPMECYYFTTERRACQEADIRGQGEWKLRFDGQSNGGDIFFCVLISLMWKETRRNFKWETGPIWSRVVVTPRQDYEQEKGKGMHKGKWCGAELTQTNIGCRMWVNGKRSSLKYSYCTLDAVWIDFLYSHTLSYSYKDGTVWYNMSKNKKININPSKRNAA